MSRPDPRQRDVYANLLRDTRGLRADHAKARDEWYAGIPSPAKADNLFELEMLLKGIGCFPNPRNLPGPRRDSVSPAHDYHQELRILRDAAERAVEVIRLLLGERDKAFAFGRYLETVLPEDVGRTRLLKEQLSQETPVDALFVLRNAFTVTVEVIDGLLRLGRISHRIYLAVHNQLVREVGRNVYFNPLTTLEFRPELDRIRSPEVLEALTSIESESAHRVAALTYLTLFRGLRYLDLVDRYASGLAAQRLGYLLLSVFRSDIRALTRFIGRRAAPVLATGLEAEILAVPASEISGAYEDLSRVAARTSSLRQTLEAVAHSLRLEVRKTFVKDLAAPEGGPPPKELATQLVLASASLRASLHHTIHLITVELRPESQPPQLASGTQARRAASDRLRRDIWMFAQVLRAFVAKARSMNFDTERWSAPAGFRFVLEFLRHFRAIGYQLVRASDYQRLEPFLRSVEVLRAVDLLDLSRLEVAIEESEALHNHLEALFRRIDRRVELETKPFDKKEAAETLRIYLGAA